MAQPALDTIARGEQLVLLVDTLDGQDLSSVPVALVLDGPNAARLTLRHLNGSADATASGGALTFTKSPDWTALYLAPGLWSVRLLTGLPATTQQQAGLTQLVVEQPSGGPLVPVPLSVPPPLPLPAQPPPTAVLAGTVFRVGRVRAASLGNASSSPPPPPVAYPGPAPTPQTANYYLRVNAAGTGFTSVPAATATTPPTVAGVTVSAGDYAAASLATALSPLLPFDPVGSSATRQPLDADLNAIAALTTLAYGRGLLTLADAAAGRTSLGLGSLAVVTPTGTASSATYLRGDNTWAAVAAGVTVSTALSDTANLARLDAANAFTAGQSIAAPTATTSALVLTDAANQTAPLLALRRVDGVKLVEAGKNTAGIGGQISLFDGYGTPTILRGINALIIDTGEPATLRLLPYSQDIYFQNTGTGSINFTGLSGAPAGGPARFKTAGAVFENAGAGTAALIVQLAASQTAAAFQVLASDGTTALASVSATGAVKTQVATVAGLTAAATAGAGSRSFVTDSTTATFAAAVAGGGSNGVPVYSDGTTWRVG